MAEQATPAPANASESEKTGAQVGGMACLQPYLTQSEAPKGTYNTYRDMLTDPTIALGDAMVRSPVLSAGWSVEGTDDAPEGAVEFIEDQMALHAQHFKANALKGGIRFGWQGYEKVFDLEDGRIGLKKLKPLLHDITEIRIDRSSGRFEGFKQPHPMGETVNVDLGHALLFTHDREGDNHYGRPLFENARKAWHRYNDAERAARRYDQKVAGANLWIHTPEGKAKLADGTEKPWIEIGVELATNWEAGKIVVTSNKHASTPAHHATGQERREIIPEILGDTVARQEQIIKRLEYLDKNKLRGLFIPERAATEGTHGTKAEAETHADLVLVMGQLAAEAIFEVLNWHVVDQLLALNWGDEARGTVEIKPSPLVDEELALYRSIFTAILQGQGGFEWVQDNIDLPAVIERLDLPELTDEARRKQAENNPDVQTGDGPPVDPQLAQTLEQ